MGFLFQGAAANATMQGAKAAAQGDILAGQAASQSDIFNAGVAETNAQILKQGATWAGQAGEGDAGISEMKTRAAVGGIKAEQAAAGVDVNVGSAVDVRASEAAKGMQDALTIRANAAKQAYGLQTQAAGETAQAGLYKSMAPYEIQAANLKSKATILSGKAQVASQFGNYLMNSSLTGGGSGGGFSAQDAFAQIGKPASGQQSPITWSS